MGTSRTHPTACGPARTYAKTKYVCEFGSKFIGIRLSGYVEYSCGKDGSHFNMSDKQDVWIQTVHTFPEYQRTEKTPFWRGDLKICGFAC